MSVELEMKNPKHLTLVTSSYLKQYPDRVERLDRYRSVSADEGVNDIFVQQVQETGYIHTPLFIEHIPEFDIDVVVAGRKRYLAAMRLGLKEVPTIQQPEDDAKTTALVEVTENMARRTLNAKEMGEGFRKLFLQGYNQEDVAKLTGKTPAYISQILAVAEMPDVVHKAIEQKKLTTQAAYGLRTLGEKAPKGSGRQRIYDPKKVKESIEALSEEARLVDGGEGKIKVKQANSSKASSLELNRNNWKALFESPNTPDDYKALIGVFIGTLSMKQAIDLAGDNLDDWFVKIDPVKPPKKEKAPKQPKIKGEGKGKKGKAAAEKVEVDINELFGE